MEKSEIKILDTHYYEGKTSAVFVELPNGQKTWLAIPLQFSFEEPFYLEGLPLYSDLEIYDEDREEYFHPQEGYFGKICGKVVAITDSSNNFYNVEVECDGLVFQIEFRSFFVYRLSFFEPRAKHVVFAIQKAAEGLSLRYNYYATSTVSTNRMFLQNMIKD